MIYDGSSKPEILLQEVENLHTSLTYTFSLFSMNKIFTSLTSADIVVKIGIVPEKPSQPEHIYDQF